MPEPLHPFTVHLPIALALLMPLFALVGALVVFRGGPQRYVWSAVIVLQAILAASALIAVETGEQEESAVSVVVPRNALEEHASRAEFFHKATWIVFAIATAGLLPGRLGHAAIVVTIVASCGVLVLGCRAGAAGGQLVYQHGAANAYK